jgi:hypothetical protein
VGPRAVLDAVVKRKIPNPHRESNPRAPIVQPVAQRRIDELSWLISDVYTYEHGHVFQTNSKIQTLLFIKIYHKEIVANI